MILAILPIVMRLWKTRMELLYNTKDSCTKLLDNTHKKNENANMITELNCTSVPVLNFRTKY